MGRLEIVSDGHGRKCGYNASTHPRTKEFISEFIELCKKHGLFLSPSHDHAVDFHDQMIVSQFDPDCECYANRTVVYLNENFEE